MNASPRQLAHDPAAEQSLEDLAEPPPTPSEVERLERLLAGQQAHPPARCRCARAIGGQPDEDGEFRCVLCGHLPRGETG